nr:hypothetical protein [Tanacetum cinerariifolium]
MGQKNRPKAQYLNIPYFMLTGRGVEWPMGYKEWDTWVWTLAHGCWGRRPWYCSGRVGYTVGYCGEDGRLGEKNGLGTVWAVIKFRVMAAPEVIAPIAEVIPQVDADSTSSPSSTTVYQDAPSSSKSHTTTEIQSSVIPQDFGDDNLNMEVAHMENDPLFGVP